MVRRLAAPRGRPSAGHSLTELVVSLALLGTGLAAAGGAGAWSAARLHDARRSSTAALAALAVLDSLADVERVVAASRPVADLTLSWSDAPPGGLLTVDVRPTSDPRAPPVLALTLQRLPAVRLAEPE
jgi:hypothetical protein